MQLFARDILKERLGECQSPSSHYTQIPVRSNSLRNGIDESGDEHLNFTRTVEILDKAARNPDLQSVILAFPLVVRGFPTPNPGSTKEQEGVFLLVQMVFLGPYSRQLPVQRPFVATLLEFDGGASTRIITMPRMIMSVFF